MARRFRPQGRIYSRARQKANAQALVEEEYYDVHDAFDPLIPASEVGGGDPGLAALLAHDGPVTIQTVRDAPTGRALRRGPVEEPAQPRVLRRFLARVRSLFTPAGQARA